MHLRTFPDHQKHFFKNDFFDLKECLKTCFDEFAHISRPPETFLQKWFFWPSGVLKNVFWCICAYFQTTRNFFFQKRYFWTSGVFKMCLHAFAHISRFFWPWEVLKYVFWCICAYFQTTSNFFSIKIFFTVWSG